MRAFCQKLDVKCFIWILFVTIFNIKKYEEHKFGCLDLKYAEVKLAEVPQIMNVSYLSDQDRGHPFISRSKAVRDVALAHPTLSN